MLCTSFQPAGKWVNLLDKDLSRWSTYLSFKHTDGDGGKIPKDAAGNDVKAIGYDKDTAQVFSVVMENGEPMLRISGEIYGCVFTKQAYANYRLRLKVRWGKNKFVPRLNEYKDSGVLYNSQGPSGVDYWHSWMLGQEFQVGEGTMGDYWPIASSRMDIRSTKRRDTTTYIFDPKGEKREYGGYCQAIADYETKADGAWTNLELIVFGDKALHLVNGKVAMALANSRYKDGDAIKPLTQGKIQLQSESAEVYYKDIQLQQITEMPKEYAGYFR
ncbi:DUF1080 domain-containing protein [Mucilaginibacter sp. R11]|uniref:DUF1080 domain-containing protein n=2 Tax=Mucilaginibacter agri TaxID=2695265 RepID=A0A965ZIH8_9SPHI|nr:DUF1080 domain-containing protein [Mucilaginibacter agri]